jgi:hypothetical protein
MSLQHLKRKEAAAHFTYFSKFLLDPDRSSSDFSRQTLTSSSSSLTLQHNTSQTNNNCFLLHTPPTSTRFWQGTSFHDFAIRHIIVITLHAPLKNQHRHPIHTNGEPNQCHCGFSTSPKPPPCFHSPVEWSAPSSSRLSTNTNAP